MKTGIFGNSFITCYFLCSSFDKFNLGVGWKSSRSLLERPVVEFVHVSFFFLKNLSCSCHPSGQRSMDGCSIQSTSKQHFN